MLLDNGEIHLEKLALHLEQYDDEIQEIAFHMGRRCLRPVGDHPCEVAFWYHKCWKTYDPKVNIYPKWKRKQCSNAYMNFFAALFLDLKWTPERYMKYDGNGILL